MRVADRQIEYTVTHRVGLGGAAERYQRPNEVRDLAGRLHRWAGGAPETCQNCHALPAVAIRAGTPLCGRCREHRALRLCQVIEHGGLTPRAEDLEEPAGLPQLRGHAIVFNKRSVDLGGFTEIIRPSAADRMEAERPDLRALWNHDSGLPIGRVSAGTLRAKKVTRGVAVEIDPPRSAAGYIESVERRDVTGQSFGFVPLEDDWHLEDGVPIRDVIDMVVIEVSVVTFPAYPDTDIKIANRGARSAWTIERQTAARLRLAR